MPKTIEEIKAHIEFMKKRASYQTSSIPIQTPAQTPPTSAPSPIRLLTPAAIAKIYTGLLKKTFQELKAMEAPAREWMIAHKYLKESEPMKWKKAMQKYDVINRALVEKAPAFANAPVPNNRYRTYE